MRIRCYTRSTTTQGLLNPLVTPHALDAECHRTWDVSISINNHATKLTTITDPFLEVEYKTIFEYYLRSTGGPHGGEGGPGSLAAAAAGGSTGLDELSRTEDLIQAYAETLLSQLELSQASLSSGATDVQVYVVEQHERGGDDACQIGGGIHCLAWELLESIQIARLPKLRLRITRVSDFAGGLTLPAPLQLLPARANSNPVFHVLLVIARDFSRSGAERDPEPDLAQWPLMSVQKKLRSRMLLEVVRPGSREELEEHLRVRAEHGVQFDLVHFDMHGKIMRDELSLSPPLFSELLMAHIGLCTMVEANHVFLYRLGNQVPWLLFARRHSLLQSREHIPQTHLARAEDVADLLARYRVENVVLNACLSAYNLTGPVSNLAHIFLQRGIQNVSAMWFYVHWQTVATYLEAFYDEFLVKGLDFDVAAQRGRDAIRREPTIRTGRAHQDYFVCVNYTRTEHRTNIMRTREPSPAPSARSQDVSTSNNSVKSFVSGVLKPTSSPRLSDKFLGGFGDEPVMRLTLHLLELEYKLLTFRAIYASDLRVANSELDTTIERMVDMWLNTNLMDDVFYYKAKDFGKRRSGHVSYREKRTRTVVTGIGSNNSSGGSGHGHGGSGGYLHLRPFLFSPSAPRQHQPLRALRQTLHIVREVDQVIDPGWQADELENRRSEQKQFLVQEGLRRFAERLHREEHSYMLLLGGQDGRWWGDHVKPLIEGHWWLHMPWSFAERYRYY